MSCFSRGSRSIASLAQSLMHPENLSCGGSSRGRSWHQARGGRSVHAGWKPGKLQLWLPRPIESLQQLAVNAGMQMVAARHCAAKCLAHTTLHMQVQRQSTFTAGQTPEF